MRHLHMHSTVDVSEPSIYASPANAKQTGDTFIRDQYASPASKADRVHVHLLLDHNSTSPLLVPETTSSTNLYGLPTRRQQHRHSLEQTSTCDLPGYPEGPTRNKTAQLPQTTALCGCFSLSSFPSYNTTFTNLATPHNHVQPPATRCDQDNAQPISQPQRIFCELTRDIYVGPARLQSQDTHALTSEIQLHAAHTTNVRVQHQRSCTMTLATIQCYSKSRSSSLPYSSHPDSCITRTALHSIRAFPTAMAAGQQKPASTATLQDACLTNRHARRDRHRRVPASIKQQPRRQQKMHSDLR